MQIVIEDVSVEARIQEQMRSTEASTVEGVLRHLLETQEEQDRRLAENRASVNAKIRRGIEQLERGEGIPDDQLLAHLARLKALPD